MSNTRSYVPAVTPDGKPVKVGTLVATPAVPTPGTAVVAWICEAVTPATNPEKFACTLIIFPVTVTVAFPVPGEVVGGCSAGPERMAV